MTGGYVSLEKKPFKKAATIKRFQCPPLSSELKRETDISKKQYQQLYEVYEIDIKT